MFVGLYIEYMYIYDSVLQYIAIVIMEILLFIYLSLRISSILQYC